MRSGVYLFSGSVEIKLDGGLRGYASLAPIPLSLGCNSSTFTWKMQKITMERKVEPLPPNLYNSQTSPFPPATFTYLRTTGFNSTAEPDAGSPPHVREGSEEVNERSKGTSFGPVYLPAAAGSSPYRRLMPFLFSQQHVLRKDRHT